MKLSNNAKERILSIHWLDNAGSIFQIPGVVSAKSVAEASECLSGLEWENTTLEASNSISKYLDINYSKEFQLWNDLAIEAKNFFEKEEISKRINFIQGFDSTILLQCIRWDVGHYLIEDAYKLKLKGRLFFENLITIYEKGHIPCGWMGEWPKGNLIVY
jgi:hypothetical protein